jgi:hypothetical protein
MLISGAVPLHDRARPHTSTATLTRALLEYFNWELFDHPPYSPALVRSDRHQFTYLKNWLRPNFFTVRHLRVCRCGAPCLTRGRSVIYNCCWTSPAQSFLGPSPAGLMTIFYCLRIETPQPGGPGPCIYIP